MRSLFERARHAIPEGRALPEQIWHSRHRIIVYILYAQTVGLVVFALARGNTLAHALFEGLPVALCATLGRSERAGRMLRSLAATFGLVTSSAVLVHLSGGTIEAHFHFFVMLGIISLYQSWGPFLLALGYVVVHHGLVGFLDPMAVYNHPAAWAQPWKWAIIHGVFVLAASAAQLVAWRFSEAARAHTELMLESAGEGMLGVDVQHRVTFMNRAVADMLGISMTQCVGHSVDDVLSPVRADGSPYPHESCPVEATLRWGATSKADDMWLTRGDERFPVDLVSTPIVRRGEIIGAMLNVRDVTERHKADEELNRTLSLLSATLESTADGILVVDNEGRITSFNHQFVDMWRIPAEVIEQHDDDAALAHVLSQLKDPDGFLAKVRELYAHPDAESRDMLEFADGRVFERYSKPQRVGGASVGRVWSFRDVTERKRLDEMKDGFLSAVSHELRTPLTAVLGFALTLQRRDEMLTGDERSEIFGRLEANARKLQRLLTDILDLDRLSRGILEPRRQPTDVGALVRGILREATFLEDRRLTFTDGIVVAALDQAKVERIVENLLTNAVRHTPPDTPIWIEVRAHPEGALLIVEDAGPGVPVEHRATIFESFRQGPSINAHAPGVGVGLALVARFAELHGGRAWVEGREGGGASFHVLLPGGAPESAIAPTTPGSSPDPSGHARADTTPAA